MSNMVFSGLITFLALKTSFVGLRTRGSSGAYGEGIHVLVLDSFGENVSTIKAPSWAGLYTISYTTTVPE